MKLTRFQAAQDFLACAEVFLLAHEAEHNLPLGLCASLVLQPDLYPSQPYFAVVKYQEEIVFAAMMTLPHQLVLSLGDSREALKLLARDVHEFRPDTPGVLGPTPVSLYFSEIWHTLTRRSFRKSRAERIYKLEKIKPPASVSGHLRRAVTSDHALLVEWWKEFQQEAFGEVDETAAERSVTNALTLPPDVRGVYLWEDPHPVSLTGYSGPTRNGIRIGPVYTPPKFRRRGYASALVAEVSQHLLDRGRRFCFLFTDLANSTSNKIYMEIGYEPVCDVDEYRFGSMDEN
jgi:predicted GNAT family acetyltransferase